MYFTSDPTVKIAWDAVSEAVGYEVRLVMFQPTPITTYPVVECSGTSIVLSKPRTGSFLVQARSWNWKSTEGGEKQYSEWAVSDDIQYATVDGQAAPWWVNWLVGMPIIDGGDTPTPTPPPEPTVETIPQNQLSVVAVDSQEIDVPPAEGENGAVTNAIDGNPSTIWHTSWWANGADNEDDPGHPHQVTISLGGPYTVVGFSYLARQDDYANGDIKGYEFYSSADGSSFEIAASGEFSSGKGLKTVIFSPRIATAVKLVALSEVNGKPWTSAAEINVLKEE